MIHDKVVRVDFERRQLLYEPHYLVQRMELEYADEHHKKKEKSGGSA